MLLLRQIQRLLPARLPEHRLPVPSSRRTGAGSLLGWHGPFCLPQRQQWGGPLQPPRASLWAGGPHLPQLPSSQAHNPPTLPWAQAQLQERCRSAALVPWVPPVTLPQRWAQTLGRASTSLQWSRSCRGWRGAAPAPPRPHSRKVSGLQSRPQGCASLVLETPELLPLWLPVSFSSFCPDNVSCSLTHMKVIISSNNFPSVFMSPIPSANSCNCQHGSTNTSAKDKAIISKHSYLSLHCHHPNHQNPGLLSASFSN